MLINWYDAARGHYIGAHRDSTTNMVLDAPIVTVSLGESRVLELRPWQGRGGRNLPADEGAIFVMPDTN